MFMVMNLAVGGKAGNPPPTSRLPAMPIDYIHVREPARQNKE